jgi:predicted ATP-grasp superfamily ATP-dependent carboligase
LGQFTQLSGRGRYSAPIAWINWSARQADHADVDVARKLEPTILVTDSGRGSAVAIIRSLGRRGWRVIAGASDPLSPGFRSRYVVDRIVYPPPASSPGEFVDAILEAVRRFGIDLIIPVTDAAILPLVGERHRVEALCKLALPDSSALSAVIDKGRTLELAGQLGVPVPRSEVVVNREEALAAAHLMGWPVVLKPKASSRYPNRTKVDAFHVAFASNESELAVEMHRLEGRSEVLIQEYCPGGGEGVGLLMDRGRPLAAFQHRRIHEVPVSGGASALRESVPLDPTLYSYSVKLLGALEWTGLAMVEFKVGERGVRLMEVNGRVWGSLPLAVMSGVDFPSRLVELFLGSAPEPGMEPQLEYRVGVRARNLELDLIWIGSVLRGRPRFGFLGTPPRSQAVSALLGFFAPGCQSDMFALSDPGPALAELPKIAGKLWRKAMR